MATLVEADNILLRVHGGPLRQVRSTLLCASIAELRGRGHLEAYLRHLPAPTAAILLPGVVGTWLPVDVGSAHYEACDKIGLNPEECAAIGGSNGMRLQKSLLQTFVRLAQGAGASPLTVLAAYTRIWNRHFDGGGLLVTRLGPKDASLEIKDFPFVRYPYFRHGFRGMNAEGLKLFARTVYVRETASTPTSIALRISWV